MCGDGRRGERGDGSICVVLMRESETERKVRGKRVPACICLIYHSAAVLFSRSFEAHSLSHLVRGLPAVCLCACVYVICIYVHDTIVNEGVYTVWKGGWGVKRFPARVDNADKPFCGSHSCSEIPLGASWLSEEHIHMHAHTHEVVHMCTEVVVRNSGSRVRGSWTEKK